MIRSGGIFKIHRNMLYMNTMLIYGFAALDKYGGCVLAQDNNFDPIYVGQKP